MPFGLATVLSVLTPVGLPEEKGSYVLILVVRQMKRLAIGRLGDYDIVPGYYAYVGSACGPGGLRARVGHHLAVAVDKPHWHIDYLLGFAQPLEVWYAVSDRKLEQDWAGLLEEAPIFQAPIARFGSSDYRRSRTSHLFYSKRRPSFRWFDQKIRQLFQSDIQPQLLALTPAPRAAG